jgi:hypothetical protein
MRRFNVASPAVSFQEGSHSSSPSNRAALLRTAVLGRLESGEVGMWVARRIEEGVQKIKRFAKPVCLLFCLSIRFQITVLEMIDDDDN